jgi:nucleotide-binding universal stress UspA family protein
MFDKILVAIDASPQRDYVLEQAAQLALRCKAELHVISVTDPVSRSGLALVEPVGEYFDDIERDARDVLAHARKVLFERGLACTVHGARGVASEEIARKAQELGVGLVMIGHRYLGWLDRLVSHSVGWDLVAQAPCSVLVVLQPAKE